MLFILLAGCVLLGESALLGAKKCTYGPSYWCDSLPNAKECRAVPHCIQTVWEKQVLPEDNDDICTLCKDMVQQARDQLLSNETQEEIREVFEGSCRLIPIKVVCKECIELADNFIPELIDTLASQMNPQVVCATAGLCNSVRIDMLLVDHQLNHPEENSIAVDQPFETPGPGDCEACKDFVTRTIRLVKTHSRAEVLDRLLAVCGRLGSLSDGCSALVEANFDGIYHFLTEELTPEDFCNLVEMCEDRMHQTGLHVRPPLKHTGDEACDFCEAIVRHWRDVLTSNTTETEFKQILDGLCHQTGKFSKNCLALVDEYYVVFYDFLMSEVNPKQICEAVGLCGMNSIFKKEYPVWTLLDTDRGEVSQTKLLPSVLVSNGHRITGLDEAAANRVVVEEELPRVKLAKTGINVVPAGNSGVLGAPLGKGHVGDGNVCVMCEFAVQFLQNMLQQKATREEIEQAVETLCDQMPHTIAEECEDYVDAYGDQVIELLAQEMDASEICPFLHLCPAHESQDVLEVQPEKQDVTCVMCEYAMTQLEDMLEDHKTEENIRHALDTLCGLLPKTVRPECQTFVDTYTEQIIQMLIDDFTPDQVCVQLGLCKPKDSVLPQLDSSHQLPISRMFVNHPAPQTNEDEEFEIQQSAVCVMCEFAMSQLDQMLSENATESQIMEVVDFVCAHLPGTLADDCIGFVEEYGDAIIKLLVHEMSPKTVCQEIKLCKPPKFTGIRAMVNVQLDECQICKGVVSYVDAKLKSGDVTVEVDTFLEEVCRLFPSVVEDKCRSIIEVYGPYIVNLLAELGEPEKVCQAVELCSTEEGAKQLLGNEKCTWGPSYWCQTKLHASACKATVHCNTKVWNGEPPQI